jgi:hypothetical protein
MTASEALKHVEQYVRWADIDLDQAQRPHWFYRPFMPEEIDAHPERERILATVKAAAEELMKEAIVDAQGEIEIDDDLPV